MENFNLNNPKELGDNEPAVDYKSMDQNWKDYVGKVELGVLKWSKNWEWYRDEYARLYECLEGDPKAARDRALKRKRIILYDPPFPDIFEKEVVPVPPTTSGLHGWKIGRKSDFQQPYGWQLERFGRFVPPSRPIANINKAFGWPPNYQSNFKW